MSRFFNTAGPCRSEIHYMIDPLPRLPKVRELIDGQHYFVLHAPRRTGKTTYLYALMRQLHAESKYTALTVNIQSAASGRNPAEAMRTVALLIADQARLFLPEEERPPAVAGNELGLYGYLSQWAEQNPKPVVLFIDEADSLLDDLLLALLSQLRTGFEARPKGFPQSIALVGLRDVRDYKIRIHPGQDSLGTNSPFNVKTESLIFANFTDIETEALLEQHTAETGQKFGSEIKREIFRLTQGQPWLTNALARRIVAKILNNDFSRSISPAHIAQAKEQLIQRCDTHLDSLIDKLREPRVKSIVEAIINGDAPPFDLLNDDLAYIRDLGLVALDPPIRFANPIYREIVPRVIGAALQEALPGDLVDPIWYIKEGRLHIGPLLRAFQKFYRRHSEAWLARYDFREAGRQLLLMAFLQQVVNAGGSVEREMAVGSGRCDLLVEYGDARYAIELKLYRDSYTREEGLEQIARYLSRLGLNEGHLIIFETRVDIPWERRIDRTEETVTGKRVVVWGM